MIRKFKTLFKITVDNDKFLNVFLKIILHICLDAYEVLDRVNTRRAIDSERHRFERLSPEENAELEMKSKVLSGLADFRKRLKLESEKLEEDLRQFEEIVDQL